MTVALRKEDGPDADADAIVAGRSQRAPLLFHKQLIGRRLYINSKIRFLVVLGIIAGAFAGRHVFGIEGLDVAGLTGLAALLALYNTGVFLVARRHRNLERRVSVYRLLTGLMHLSIAVDFVFLTVVLWIVGGAKSPFLPFYLIHVIVASSLLSRRAACAHALFGYVLMSGLVLGEWWRLLPVRFPVGIVNSGAVLDGRYVLTVLVVQGFLMALAIYLVAGLTGVLRRGESQLRQTNLELERLSRMQRDFLHIALHDLKGSVNAATMLIQSLKITSPSLTEGQLHWLNRAYRRLNEATAFLHDFSVLAALDAVDIKEESTPIDTSAMVNQVVAENEDMIHSRNQNLRVQCDGLLPPVHGQERLVHEAVSNLVSNASKYTPPRGSIILRAFQRDDRIRFEVEDTGIGISPSDQKRLFQEFVRIRRKDSAVGEVAGSGLGLSIVSRIAKAHGGKVGVESELNRGSTFFIELPSTGEQPLR